MAYTVGGYWQILHDVPGNPYPTLAGCEVVETVIRERGIYKLYGIRFTEVDCFSRELNQIPADLLPR